MKTGFLFEKSPLDLFRVGLLGAGCLEGIGGEMEKSVSAALGSLPLEEKRKLLARARPHIPLVTETHLGTVNLNFRKGEFSDVCSHDRVAVMTVMAIME